MSRTSAWCWSLALLFLPILGACNGGSGGGECRASWAFEQGVVLGTPLTHQPIAPIRLQALRWECTRVLGPGGYYCEWGFSRAPVSGHPVLALHEALSGLAVEGETIPAGASEVHFIPAVPLQPNVTYRVNVVGGYTDCNVRTPSEWTFTPWEPDGLDQTFGTGGAVLLPWEAGPSAQSPAGETLLATAAGIVKLDAAGKVVTGFGEGGLAPIGQTTDLQDCLDADGWLGGLIGSQDGTVVAIACGMLFRLGTDGAFDASFGVDGVVRLGADLPGPATLSIDSAARILVAFVRYVPDGPVLNVTEVHRYTPDGGVDGSYGESGVVSLPGAAVVQHLPDGRLLAVSAPATGAGIIVRRLDGGGALDPAFGVAGAVVLPGLQFYGNPIGVDADGRLVIAARLEESPYLPTLVRLDPSGAVDSGFAVGGVSPPVPTEEAFDVVGLAVAGDGRVVMRTRSGSDAWSGLTWIDAEGNVERQIPTPISIADYRDGPVVVSASIAFDSADHLVFAAPWYGVLMIDQNRGEVLFRF